MAAKHKQQVAIGQTAKTSGSNLAYRLVVARILVFVVIATIFFGLAGLGISLFF